MTGVFIAGDDVVLRVCRPTAPPTSALDLARVLVEHGLHVPAPVRPDVVEVDELAVLAFQRLHASDEPIDWFEVGRMIATLHALDAESIPAEHPLPRGLDFPWWQLERLLDDLGDVIDQQSSSAMRECLVRHRPALAVARGVEGVVCHGDLHVGNVMQTSSGPALLDWDLLCREPAGWDHAALRTWAARWGGEPGAYESFVAGCAEQFDDDPFTIAVAELRLMAATLMRVRAAQSDPTAAAEAGQRLRWWRGDPSAPMWRAV
jgi:Ser/Thr protein kinase RdoA (MazF antagonist)